MKSAVETLDIRSAWRDGSINVTELRLTFQIVGRSMELLCQLVLRARTAGQPRPYGAF